MRLGFANQFSTDLYVAKAYCPGSCALVAATEGQLRDDTRVFFVVTARN
jgi:hypothetical protein